MLARFRCAKCSGSMIVVTKLVVDNPPKCMDCNVLLYLVRK